MSINAREVIQRLVDFLLADSKLYVGARLHYMNLDAHHSSTLMCCLHVPKDDIMIVAIFTYCGIIE